MAVALIVAAGSGERLGAGGPKALVPVGGRPMLEWSLEALAQVPAVRAIVVALPASVGDFRLPAGVIGVPGGEARSASVLAALEAAPDGDPVIVHDAARPLATPDLFTAMLEYIDRFDVDGLIAAAVSTNTLKLVHTPATAQTAGAAAGTVRETIDRAAVWAVQTPQVFRRPALERVLRAATPAQLAAATDDASLIEQAGGTIRVHPSDDWNIKITWPRDLAIAELLLSER